MSDAERNARREIDRIKVEHRALAILRFLQREVGYRTNERILGDYLDLLALGCISNELRAAVSTLESSGLVTTGIRDDLMIVSLTRRGEEVALGHRVVDGVIRPGLEEKY